MKKEIIIDSSPHEIRIAILEDEELVELLMERADSRRIVGNVYKGVVTSVKPGLQAAFIDIGLEKAGFLHASDLVHEDPDDEDLDAPGPGGRRGDRRDRHVPDIGRSLKVGEELLVQVTKEQIGSKGPRLTADLSLPGRFLVLMPKGRHIGVSRKIEDRRERVRLKQILQQVRADDGAYIIRTAAEGVSEEQFRNDVKYLSSLWKQIQANAGQGAAPCLVHEDVGMVVGLIRDIFSEDVDRLVIDDREDYERLVKYVQTFAPELKGRIKHYQGALPIFDHYEIEPEIRKSLERRVWMKKGGYIVIEQTEALVSIDVNTGRFTGKRNQEDTIYQTNMIAAREVARQLRLRDVGGIIVIDFIDMENESNKKRVLAELRSHLKRDRARTKTFAVSSLGLVEMSRQRVRPSLLAFLSDPCPYCTGTGKVLSLETLSNRLERMIQRIVSLMREKKLQLQANPTLALYILEERAEQFRELCRANDIEIDVLDDPALHREEYRLLSLTSERDLLAEVERLSRAGVRSGEPAGRSAARPGGEARLAGRGDDRPVARAAGHGEARGGGHGEDEAPHAGDGGAPAERPPDDTAGRRGGRRDGRGDSRGEKRGDGRGEGRQEGRQEGRGERRERRERSDSRGGGREEGPGERRERGSERDSRRSRGGSERRRGSRGGSRERGRDGDGRETPLPAELAAAPGAALPDHAGASADAGRPDARDDGGELAFPWVRDDRAAPAPPRESETPPSLEPEPALERGPEQGPEPERVPEREPEREPEPAAGVQPGPEAAPPSPASREPARERQPQRFSFPAGDTARRPTDDEAGA